MIETVETEEGMSILKKGEASQKTPSQKMTVRKEC